MSPNSVFQVINCYDKSERVKSVTGRVYFWGPGMRHWLVLGNGFGDDRRPYFFKQLGAAAVILKGHFVYIFGGVEWPEYVGPSPGETEIWEEVKGKGRS